MVNQLTWFIGRRFFFSRNHSRLTSFISFLAMAGLVLGVGLLIVVLSVMNGFDREMRERILSIVPHVQLFEAGGVANWQALAERVSTVPGVLEATPFTQLHGMLSFRGQVEAVSLLGLEPGAIDGALAAALPDGIESRLGQDSILVPQTIARALGVDVGDRLTLIVPRTSDSGQSLAPKAQALAVVGVFNTHTAEDNGLAIVHVQTANALKGLGDRPQGLRLRLDDVFSARDTGYLLLRQLPGDISFIDWLQTHGNLYQAIQMSRQLVGLLVFLIIAIAVFNVISMMVMTVVDKKAAIAILKTQGASNARVLAIFCVQGSLIGISGCLLGLLLGVPAALNISALVAAVERLLGVHFLNAEIYPIDYLPSQLLWIDVLTIVGVALVLNFIATLYPAWKAMRVRPASILRYE
jgi:lipoprotein releasing system, transmembrane protein, LolC/E family